MTTTVRIPRTRYQNGHRPCSPIDQTRRETRAKGSKTIVLASITRLVKKSLGCIPLSGERHLNTFSMISVKELHLRRSSNRLKRVHGYRECSTKKVRSRSCISLRLPSPFHPKAQVGQRWGGRLLQLQPLWRIRICLSRLRS